MEHQYITEETLENIIYTNQSFVRAEYEYCTFKSCDFSEIALKGSKFYQTQFINCNLSNADLSQVSLQDVKFKNCKMLGLHFIKCNTLGFAAFFDGCQLDYSVFHQMKLSNTSFVDSKLQGVDFAEAELMHSQLRNCDLLEAIFDHTNLEKADFTKSINYSINPQINYIKGAKFSLPEVVGLLDVYQINIE